MVAIPVLDRTAWSSLSLKSLLFVRSMVVVFSSRELLPGSDTSQPFGTTARFFSLLLNTHSYFIPRHPLNSSTWVLSILTTISSLPGSQAEKCLFPPILQLLLSEIPYAQRLNLRLAAYKAHVFCV